MKIKLDYEDRKFFHPAPTPRMRAMIMLILEKLNWQIEVAPEELTRDEAKQLIKKGLSAAKRREIRLKDTEIDEVNSELASLPI